MEDAHEEQQWRVWKVTNDEGEERELFIPGEDASKEDANEFLWYWIRADEVFKDIDDNNYDRIVDLIPEVAAPMFTRVIFEWWVTEIKEVEEVNEIHQGAAHYEFKQREDAEDVLSLKEEGFDFEATNEAFQDVFRDSIDREQAAWWITTHFLAWYWINGLDREDHEGGELINAFYYYVNHLIEIARQAIGKILDSANSRKGRLYCLERLLHVKEIGHPPPDTNPDLLNIRARFREMLKEDSLREAEKYRELLREFEHKAANCNQWDEAARKQQARSLIDSELSAFLSGDLDNGWWDKFEDFVNRLKTVNTFVTVALSLVGFLLILLTWLFWR